MCEDASHTPHGAPHTDTRLINKLLNIHWCPDQNYFLVKLLGHPLPPLKFHNTMFAPVWTP